MEVASRTAEMAESRATGARRPQPPETLAETGLSRESITDLILKILYVQGARTGNHLTEAVCLPFDIVDDILLELQHRRFAEVRSTNGPSRGGYTFDVTGPGRERAKAALEACQYAGPAPVPLAQYRQWVEAHSVRTVRVSKDRIREGFRGMVLDETLFDTLGPAINSAASLFLYGAPGNGKTLIAETIAGLLGEEGLYIPYAVDIDGQIMVLYDPVHHRRMETEREGGEDWDEIAYRLLRQGEVADRRYVKVSRPVVVTGGELTLDQLDLQYDQHTKMYQAPFQVKANGGVLIIDDFGRQRVPAHELLNRWIVPLEKKVDYLTLHTGVKFPIPFDCLVIFATNLDPNELVDEAFVRRIHYKIQVPGPAREGYEEIFRRACAQQGLEYSASAVDFVYERYYFGRGIPPRACHPRDILGHLDSIAKYEGRPVALTGDLLERACRSYFLIMAADVMMDA